MEYTAPITQYRIRWGFQCFPVFKRRKRTIRNRKCQLLKITRSRYIGIFIKSWKGLELVSSLQHWAENMLEMFVTRYTSILPNFILMVLNIQKNKHKSEVWNLQISQKHRNLDISRTKHFLQIKKNNYTSRAFLLQKNSFVVGVTLHPWILPAMSLESLVVLN